MRRLTLRREALAELASDDLRLVQGGYATQYCVSNAKLCATNLGLCAVVDRLPTMRCTPPPA
jgi:hypothetical protein